MVGENEDQQDGSPLDIISHKMTLQVGLGAQLTGQRRDKEVREPAAGGI
jgi:hypothetical protein